MTLRAKPSRAPVVLAPQLSDITARQARASRGLVRAKRDDEQ